MQLHSYKWGIHVSKCINVDIGVIRAAWSVFTGTLASRLSKNMNEKGLGFTKKAIWR